MRHLNPAHITEDVKGNVKIIVQVPTPVWLLDPYCFGYVLASTMSSWSIKALYIQETDILPIIFVKVRYWYTNHIRCSCTDLYCVQITSNLQCTTMK